MNVGLDLSSIFVVFLRDVDVDVVKKSYGDVVPGLACHRGASVCLAMSLCSCWNVGSTSQPVD